jgi:DNA-binding GntR family transcriptional regulator
MREVHVAAELGISRAPLREALRRLEEEGLVVKVPFRGTFVTEVSEESIRDIARLRSVLEPWAIEQGLQTLQGERLSDLRRLVAQLATAARKGNVQSSITAHLAFHRTIYESAGNEVLTSLWRGWENQLRLFLAADYRKYDDPMASHRDHEALLALIEKGDLGAIRRLLGSHIHGGETPTGATDGKVGRAAGTSAATRDRSRSRAPIPSAAAGDSTRKQGKARGRRRAV